MDSVRQWGALGGLRGVQAFWATFRAEAMEVKLLSEKAEVPKQRHAKHQVGHDNHDITWTYLNQYPKWTAQTICGHTLSMHMCIHSIYIAYIVYNC